jgi:hypothetical protein
VRDRHAGQRAARAARELGVGGLRLREGEVGVDVDERVQVACRVDPFQVQLRELDGRAFLGGERGAQFGQAFCVH